MAREHQILGTDHQVKERNPWFVGIISFVTIFIYTIFWYYFINKEMAKIGKAKNTEELGTSPGISVLAITLGALIIVPALVSLYNTCRRIQKTQQTRGVEFPLNGWIALILYLIFSPALFAYMQSELNQAWKTNSDKSLVLID